MIITIGYPGSPDIIFKTDKDKVLIGRKSICDIVISKDEISREHCLIELRGEEIFVTDLKSVNGVFINGERIPLSVPVLYQPIFSLVISFGYEIRISLEVENAEVISAPTLMEARPLRRKVLNEATKTKIAQPNQKERTRFLPYAFLSLVILGIAFYFLQNEGEINMPLDRGPSTYEKSYH